MYKINNAVNQFIVENSKNYKEYYNFFARDLFEERERWNNRERELLDKIEKNFLRFISETAYYKDLENLFNNDENELKKRAEFINDQLQIHFGAIDYALPRKNLHQKKAVIRGLLSLLRLPEEDQQAQDILEYNLSEKLKKHISNYLELLHIGLVCYLEAFLQDTFIMVFLYGNNAVTFAQKYPELSREKISKIENECQKYNNNEQCLEEFKKTLKAIALEDVIWHQHEKVKRLYRCLGINFDLGKDGCKNRVIKDAIKVRHDIAHSGGKKKGQGEEKHEIDSKSIEKLIESIDFLAEHINNQWREIFFKNEQESPNIQKKSRFDNGLLFFIVIFSFLMIAIIMGLLFDFNL